MHTAADTDGAIAGGVVNMRLVAILMIIAGATFADFG